LSPKIRMQQKFTIFIVFFVDKSAALRTIWTLCEIKGSYLMKIAGVFVDELKGGSFCFFLGGLKMANKTLITGLIFSFVLLFIITGHCYADVLGNLEQFETYKWYPAQAESIYQQVLQQYPGTDNALKAHKNLVISYILAKRDGNAQQKLNQLSTDFSGNSGLAVALYDIARVYERTRKYTEATSIYQQITQNHPGSVEAVKVQLSSSRIDILTGIDKKVDVANAINQLIADFGNHTELPSTLYDIARRHERAKAYERAKGLYQKIIQDYPNSLAANSAQLGVRRAEALSYIEAKDYGQAQAAVAALIADFSSNPDLSEALYDIGIRYERARQYNDAKNIYQQITQSHPDSSHACRAGLDASKVDIYLLVDAGQTSAAQTAIDNLITNFSGHTCLPESLKQIAKRCEWAKTYEQAKNVHQQIAQLYPGSVQATNAQLNAAKCQILGSVKAGQYGGILPAVNQMVSGYQGQKHLPWAVKQIANQYRDKASGLEGQGLTNQAQSCFGEVAQIYEIVLNQLPASTANAEACYYAGECYRRLGNYPKSTEYFQKVVDEHSHYNQTANALFRVGHNYEKMLAAGQISKSEAEPKIKIAYQQLLDKYPDSAMAGYANSWLSNHNSQ